MKMITQLFIATKIRKEILVIYTSTQIQKEVLFLLA